MKKLFKPLKFILLLSFTCLLVFLLSHPISAATLTTGIGDIDTTPEGFVAGIARRLAGIVGGLALLFLMYGSILYMFSRGDPKALEKASQIIGSAMAGLFFVMFSVLIMRVIGYDILKLPGLGSIGGEGLIFPDRP